MCNDASPKANLFLPEQYDNYAKQNDKTKQSDKNIPKIVGR